MFARLDENPAMTLQDIKKQNVTDGRTHTHTHARTDNMKTVYPPQTKFAGGIKKMHYYSEISCDPSIHIIDHLTVIASNQNKESISIQRIIDC